jgi:hypothetical protein
MFSAIKTRGFDFIHIVIHSFRGYVFSRETRVSDCGGGDAPGDRRTPYHGGAMPVKLASDDEQRTARQPAGQIA